MALNIRRSHILADSIEQFKSSHVRKKKIQVVYINETGEDSGGIVKDWLSTVIEEINNSGTFKPDPSGKYLTIDLAKADEDILEFTGQLIAISFNQELNLDVKLSLFIWRLLMKEKITINDMEEYDQSIYNSLKWILENDVSELEEVFVDSNDVELIENGKNVPLTNENKEEYVKLMINRIFMGQNDRLFHLIVTGFYEIINKKRLKRLKQYDAIKMRETINGQEKIDLDDWRKNTVFYGRRRNYYGEYEEDDDNEENQETLDIFFGIIGDWAEKDLRRLLNFVTGSPLVPIKGFAFLPGGPFTIKLCDGEKLPFARTCFNTLYISNTTGTLAIDLYESIKHTEFNLE